VLYTFFQDPLRPLVLGGDHSISFPVIRAVSEKLGGPVDVLHLDAHPDNYDAFEGNIYSHASSFARVMEGDYVRRLLQVTSYRCQYKHALNFIKLFRNINLVVLCKNILFLLV
jgi:arginase family enzyme